MCTCCCDCCFGNCDILMMILRCCLKKMCTRFLTRCYIGFVFDLIEYGILTATAKEMNNDRFVGIFVLYGMFIALITVCNCCDYTVYKFPCVFFFKGISLSVALSIFTTSSDFEWNTITTHFKNIDSFGSLLLALVIFVSFVDICISITILIINTVKIVYVTRKKNYRIFEAILMLFTEPFDQISENN